MKVLITGGGGFLGEALVKASLKRQWQVKSFSRGDYPHLRNMGVDTVRGDLADGEAIIDAATGCDVVCHVAAKAGIWGTYRDYYRSNTIGTQNVIDACRVNGIKRLVYTSSPSVVFDGKSHEGATEEKPYPKKYLSHYPKTKAMAEQMVLGANGKDLATVSLRPHLIWGPGDNHLIPRLIARARAGQLKLVGNGQNRVDSVYIDNAVIAHLNAVDKLAPGSPISGKAYFISNGEPLPIAELINGILAAADMKPVTGKVPVKVAYVAGALLELIYAITRNRNEPRMTRFLALELSCSHWYDLSVARNELGYYPKVTVKEGFARLKKWLISSPWSWS